MGRTIQIVKGKRQWDLVLGNVRLTDRREERYLLMGIKGIAQHFHGDLNECKKKAVKWELKRVTDVRLYHTVNENGTIIRREINMDGSPKK